MLVRGRGPGSATLVLGAALAGCDNHGSNGSGDRVLDGDEATAALSSARDTVEGLVADLGVRLGRALETVPRGGNASYDLCGMDPAPSGRTTPARLCSSPSALSEIDAVDAAVAVLEDDDWTVERAPNPQIVEASRDDGFSVRVQVSPFSVDVQVESACLNTSVDLAHEYSRRPAVDVDLGS